MWRSGRMWCKKHEVRAHHGAGADAGLETQTPSDMMLASRSCDLSVQGRVASIPAYYRFPRLHGVDKLQVLFQSHMLMWTGILTKKVCSDSTPFSSPTSVALPTLQTTSVPIFPIFHTMFLQHLPWLFSCWALLYHTFASPESSL